MGAFQLKRCKMVEVLTGIVFGRSISTGDVVPRLLQFGSEKSGADLPTRNAGSSHSDDGLADGLVALHELVGRPDLLEREFRRHDWLVHARLKVWEHIGSK